MKKQLILTIATILYFALYNSTIAQIATFEFDKMNVAYRGLPNQITINIDNQGNNKSIPNLSTENGSFKFIDSTSNASRIQYRFEGEFEKTGNHTIFIKSRSDTILTYQMRCKNIPDPQFMLDLKYKAGEIEKKTLKKTIGAGAILKNFDFYYQFKLKTYRVTIVKDGAIYETFECSNFRFTDEMKDVLKSMDSNDIIIFDKIVVEGDNGEERNIQSVNYRIK